MLIAIEPLGQVDRSTQRMPSTGGKRTMPMDAYRDGEQLIMKFDLPGIEPDSMELNVDNNVLTIKAHRPRQQIEDSQWVVSERLHGTFSAQLHLIRQPHFVMFEALSLVVASFRTCLVGSSPVRPVVGVAAGVVWVCQCGP
jgi:Hsp20/alpha crystallin family